MDDEHDEDRETQVRNALLKVVGVVVAIGMVVAIGTTIMVRVLGLDEGDSSGPVGAAPADPPKALPTTALPGPEDSSDDETAEAAPTDEPSDLVTPKEGKKGRIEMDVSPVNARPMERVNLTGTYAGGDNVGLKVQRFVDGSWADFGDVEATVRNGTFATYIQTGRSGENRFRMYDPTADRGSNVVLVTID